MAAPSLKEGMCVEQLGVVKPGQGPEVEQSGLWLTAQAGTILGDPSALSPGHYENAML